MSFTHLKVHTGHSISKSIITLEDLLEKCTQYGLKSVAVTDTNNLFTTIDFYEKALSKGIKPIIAVNLGYYDNEAEVKPENKKELNIYVKDAQGYTNLNKLISKMWLENNHADDSGILRTWLTKESTKGLIITSGGNNGSITSKLLAGKNEEAEQEALFFKDLMAEDFFLEVERDASINENDAVAKTVDLCTKLDIPPVAVQPVYMLAKEDYLLHEIKTCINTQEKVYDRSRQSKYNKEMYLKNEKEMQELFSDLPQAIENTNIIAQKCNLEISLGKNFLPKFATPQGQTETEYLKELANKGLKERLDFLYPDASIRAQKEAEYQARLDTELGIIEQMGFAGYFLIVADFINYAKQNGIPVGAGRGSGAGSLVAYAVSITDIDPLEFGLLFERFLNPERISMPDFDIDFCPKRRGEVINYVKDKYGHDKVAQISTFSTLAPRAAIKDVARALAYTHGLGESITSLIKIPAAKAHEIDLKSYLFGNPDKGIASDEKLKALYDSEDDVKLILDLAIRLEGLPRQVGMHAGGVLISPTDMNNFTPLYKKDSSSDVVSQYDKDSVEKAGLVKFDFLGISELTMVDECVRAINKQKEIDGEEPIDVNKIKTNDPAIFSEIFAKGNTTGIFQFESTGMKSLFKQIKPDKFEDLIALNALYRPGPMDIISQWVDSKLNPENREYPDEKLKPILEETYGFMIYQEQVMQCAQIIAGYSLGQADILRRAMGKKKPEEMAAQRSSFLAGAAKNGMSEQKANFLFDLIDKFSGYGFNKSHAAAYSKIAYQTAFLKYYYTQYYMQAKLNSELGDTDKLSIVVSDARLNGIEVLAPDINKSKKDFSIETSKSIRYAFLAVKGVGEVSAKAIEDTVSEGGEFKDIYDFLERIPKGSLNKRTFDPLIQAGAFDSIHSHRAQLLANSAQLLKYHKDFHDKKAKENSSPTQEIPGFTQEAKTKKKKIKEIVRPELTKTEEWNDKDTLLFEKQSIGYYLTGDPVASYLKDLGGFVAATPPLEIKQDYEELGRDRFLVCGVISDIIPYKSKTGAFVKINNGSQTLELMVRNEYLNKYPEHFKVDAFMAFNVSVFEGNDAGVLKYSTKDAYTFDECLKATAARVFVAGEESDLEKFQNICASHPGKTQIDLCTVPANSVNAKRVVFTSSNVQVSKSLLDELKHTFGEQWVKLNFIDKVNLFDFNGGNKNKNRRRP